LSFHFYNLSFLYFENDELRLQKICFVSYAKYILVISLTAEVQLNYIKAAPNINIYLLNVKLSIHVVLITIISGLYYECFLIVIYDRNELMTVRSYGQYFKIISYDRKECSALAIVVIYNRKSDATI